MLPISNEITMFNIDDNGNPTTPHEMKNTTLACSLCFIQEKTVSAILDHHQEDHLMKFLSEKKITLKNFLLYLIRINYTFVKTAESYSTSAKILLKYQLFYNRQ